MLCGSCTLQMLNMNVKLKYQPINHSLVLFVCICCWQGLTLQWPYTLCCPWTCTVHVLESARSLLHVLGFYHPAVKLSIWWKTGFIFDDGSKRSKRSLSLRVTPRLVRRLIHIIPSLLPFFTLYHAYPHVFAHSVTPLIPHISSDPMSPGDL